MKHINKSWLYFQIIKVSSDLATKHCLAQQEFREKFFKEIVLFNLAAKQFKRRQNAFYILAHLIQYDANFAPVALKAFHKIKDILFKSENLPDLTDLEMTADFLKFKVFVNTKVHEWTERHSGEFPDLFIWKKIQSQFLQGAASQQAPPQGETFKEKFHQLKIYRAIFERNQRECEFLKTEFFKIKFECAEAKKLMHQEHVVPVQPTETLIETTGIEQQEEEKGSIQGDEQQQQNLIDSLEQDEMNFLEHFVGSEGAQIDAPLQKFIQKPEEPLSIHIENFARESNKFAANSKNLTLFRVLNDNRKIVERRVIPLLEMFKVETAFFRMIQNTCMSAVQEKKENESIEVRLKVTKKDVEEFDTTYIPIEAQGIDKLQQVVDWMLSKVAVLKHELELVKLKSDIADATGNYSQNLNDVQIVDEDEEGLLHYEEEDPDEQLFK